MTIQKLKNALEIFILNKDRSVSWAKSLETILDEIDEEFDELQEYLASYTPSGGELLFDENQMEIVCKRTLKKL